MFVACVGVLVGSILTRIISGMGTLTCDMLYIFVIVHCRFRFAATVLIVEPVSVAVCKVLVGGNGMFDVVVYFDFVNLILFLVVGGYSGGAFLLCSFGFGSGGGGGLCIPRNLSSVFFCMGGWYQSCAE